VQRSLPKLSLQTKNILALLSSALLGLFSAVAANRWDAGSAAWLAPAFLALVMLALQIWLLIKVESKEEEDLSQQRKGRMDSEHQRQALVEALVNEMKKALDERRYEDFNKLEEKREKYHG
jgi:hypothetical protein